MITEDYCSFEVAKLLKEKGFDYQGFDYIDFEGEVIRQDRPTHQMAMKWLRETYRIDIVIEISDPSVKDRKYYCMIWDKNNDSYILDLFDSYKEAVDAALKYVLENLI